MKTVAKVFRILITVAILGVIANDVWRFAATQKHLNAVAYDLTDWAQKNSGMQSRNAAATALVAAGQAQNIEIRGYDQQGSKVKLQVAEKVEGTIVLGGVVNMINGMGFQEAWDAPFYVTDRREMGFNI